jgi:glycosyltransferase involved in cell wall biosynthesis
MAADRSGKPVALTLMGAFWPGNESSGPNISLMAMIDALAGDVTFLRVARDRPTPADAPLAASGVWLETEGGAARYCPPGPRGRAQLAAILRETPHDLLLLNGFHDREFTIPTLTLRRLGLAPRRPTILSPRGEFSAAALDMKPLRKATYRFVARLAGLVSDVWMHATSAEEAHDIGAACPSARGCLIAPNIRPLLTASPHESAPDGVTRLAFLGRISRVKNLDLALQALACVRSKIVFDIFGPVEDPAYWRDCQRIAAALPPNITVVAQGEIANGAAAQMFARHDLLFLPSRSENFGHAIFEALCCGVPVLIGNATPWRNLEETRAGWDLPLDPQAFADAIDQFSAMDATARALLRAGARALAERRAKESDAVEATRRMFAHALEGSTCAA